MRILFYSEKCNFCLKLLEYIDKNNIADFFKMICIDRTNNIPKHITLIPTIIDTTIEAPFEGKKAFEYVINQKYFNHPTNNLEYIKPYMNKDGKPELPQPQIEEDARANTSRSGSGFIYVNQDTEKKFSEKEERNHFEQVFNFKQLQSNQNIQTNSHIKVQQQSAPPSDERVNQLIAQRNIEDRKMQMLRKLRN